MAQGGRSFMGVGTYFALQDKNEQVTLADFQWGIAYGLDHTRLSGSDYMSCGKIFLKKEVFNHKPYRLPKHDFFITFENAKSYKASTCALRLIRSEE